MELITGASGAQTVTAPQANNITIYEYGIAALLSAPAQLTTHAEDARGHRLRQRVCQHVLGAGPPAPYVLSAELLLQPCHRVMQMRMP